MFSSVLDLNLNKWDITDSLGKIIYLNKSVPFELRIEAMGYLPKQITITKDTTIFLERLFNNLNEVVVKSKKLVNKNYISKNGSFKYTYNSIWSGKFHSYGSIVHFSDSLISLNQVQFSAFIKGNLSNRIVKLRIYKLEENIKDINALRLIDKDIKEIYSYELKDVFNSPDNKRVTFYVPPNILLNAGFYLISFQLFPNGQDKLSIKFSNDKFIHSFNNRKSNYWVFDCFEIGERYFNMKLKINYSVY
jgi:hypothetical protein